jgi:hypothetical protein
MKVCKMAAMAAVLSGAAFASADIVISAGPGDIPGDDNVLFNDSSLINTGTTVQGLTQNPSLIVDFEGTEELTTPAAGQARIEASDRSFNSLGVFLHDGGTYTSLIVNLNALADGTVTFNIFEPGGAQTTGTFDIDGPGENFFRIQAINGQLIERVNFTTTSGLLDVRQVRIGGQSPVPEPASIAALSLGTLALIRRRRSK